MRKQPLSTINIDNRLLELIERHPGIENYYVQGVQQYLEENKLKVYERTAIWRIVNNRTRLNPKNIVIKQALESFCKTFQGQLETA